MKDTVVLAFSGGLDTSYCVLDLRRRGYAVHSVFVDTGGVGVEERAYIRERAEQLGAERHWEVSAGADLWNEFVRPLIWSHARMLEQYPLLCSDRYLIVRKALALCDQLGTRNFAHGCTGMGNDQLRFDQTVRSLGDYTILAPIRENIARRANWNNGKSVIPSRSTGPVWRSSGSARMLFKRSMTKPCARSTRRRR